MEDQLDTMNLLKNLTPDQSARYVEFEKLFDSKGWKYVTEWVNQQITVVKDNAVTAPSWEVNRINVGRAEAFQQFIDLQKGILHEFATLADANANESEEDDSSIDIASQS